MIDSHTAALRLRERAHSLRSLARRLEVLQVMVLHRAAGIDVWVGPSQEHCELALRSHRAQVLVAVRSLQLTARRMDRAADELLALAKGTAQ